MKSSCIIEMTSCLLLIYSGIADVNIWLHRSLRACIYAVSVSFFQSVLVCVLCTLEDINERKKGGKRKNQLT